MHRIQTTIFSFLLLVAGLAVGGDTQAADPKPDMRLVIDISGSMKKTDPENLRIPASKLLVNLAKDGTQFGVWTFGQYVNMLVPHKLVNGDWRKKALEQIELINSVALYTNIGEALEKASLGQSEPDAAWDRTIVLLSDGMVDISKSEEVNNAEQKRILTEVIPQLKKAGFKIHAVALSEAADTEFLKQIALETNGSFSMAKTADELMSVFVQASDQVNKPEQVPLEGNKFQIDSAVQEFTALIYRKPGSSPTELFNPQNQRITVNQKADNISWFSDARYDLITVRQPQPGEWRVKAAIDPDNRVTVVTDLSLVMEGLPDNLIEGEKVTMTMHLSEKGKPITNPRFLSLMDITFSQETSSGERFAGKLSHNKSGKPKIPQDGIYSAKLGRTLTEGEHLFEVFVDGKTFQRKRSHRVTVHRDVLHIQQNFTLEDGIEKKFLLVKPKAALIDPEQIAIVAQLRSPSEQKVIQEAKTNDSGQWQIDVPQFAEPGIYNVLVKVSGKSANGLPFELIQGPYEVDYTPVGVVEEPLPDLDDLAEEFVEEDLEIPDLEQPEETPVNEAPNEIVIEEPAEPINEVPVEEVREAQVDEASEDSDGLSLTVIIILAVIGNGLLIGGGYFIYRKTVKKEEKQIETVEEEITRLQKQRSEMTKTQPQPEPPVATGAEPETTETDGSFFDDEEETVVKTANEATPEADLDEATVAQPAPPVTEEPIPEEENQAYVNQAAPLEIDDDEMIEVDDFDDFDEDSIGDLDEMLSEQEQAEAGEENADKEKNAFAEDEFRLDNPEDK